MNIIEKNREIICEPSGDEEDEYDVDERQIYLIRWIMSTPKYEKKIQSHQLLKNMVFSSITDDGSCENKIREASKTGEKDKKVNWKSVDEREKTIEKDFFELHK